MPGTMLPAAVYGLQVPAGDDPIPSAPDFPATFRITMAAIDPSAAPQPDESLTGPPRATLKILRVAMDDDSDDEDDSDYDEDDDSIEAIKARLAGVVSDEDSEEDSDDEDTNGGPSDPAKTKEALLKKILAAENGEMDDEDMEDVDGLPNGINGTKLDKGKGKAIAMIEDEDEDDELDSEDLGIEEFVLCTLDPNQHYQQPLDITVGEHERVFFKVSGTHDVFLTGNYVLPPDDEDDDMDSEDGEYDLSPDEDEYDMEDVSSEDELDGIDDPRITEVDSDSEADAPKLIPTKGGKGKNKRVASESGETLDDLIKASQNEANGEKLSKKQAKKLKNNAGQATEAPEEKSAIKKDGEGKNGAKKVQFAKQLEQGPTPSPNNKTDGKKADKKEEAKGKKETGAKPGIRMVDGVKIDDRKIGTGAGAKKGNRISMRYIGKLEKTGKVFDANKKGPPFAFKLGTGEVIKGWDIGIAGMQVGGERKITIPANLAYGSKGAPPDIPPNSSLVFEVKMISIK